MDSFQQLVFSGGGTRCFWHGGFLETARKPLHLAPERISGVSGGALTAACFIAKRGQALRKIMGRALERTDENVDLDDDEPGSGLTPHQRIYRNVVKETLDEEAERTVANGPSFQVLLAYPPSSRLPKWSTLPLMLAYQADLIVRSTPQIKWPSWGGLTSELIDARQAAQEGKLVDLICNAAVIPPVFNLQGWAGKKVVDGGLACKAPLPDPSKGHTLILLTRQFRNLPDHPDHEYVTVSEETPADKLDFTERRQIEETWKMGEEAGKRFLRDRGMEP